MKSNNVEKTPTNPPTDQLLQQLIYETNLVLEQCKYNNRSKILKDSALVLKYYGGFIPILLQNQLLFELQGNLPVTYNGKQFDIFIHLRFQSHYPDYPPQLFLKNINALVYECNKLYTANLSNQLGEEFVFFNSYIPYCKKWDKKSNIIKLIQQAQIQLGVAFPFFKRLKPSISQTQQPVYQQSQYQQLQAKQYSAATSQSTYQMGNGYQKQHTLPPQSVLQQQQQPKQQQQYQQSSINQNPYQQNPYQQINLWQSQTQPNVQLSQSQQQQILNQSQMVQNNQIQKSQIEQKSKPNENKPETIQKGITKGINLFGALVKSLTDAFENSQEKEARLTEDVKPKVNLELLKIRNEIKDIIEQQRNNLDTLTKFHITQTQLQAEYNYRDQVILQETNTADQMVNNITLQLQIGKNVKLNSEDVESYFSMDQFSQQIQDLQSDYQSYREGLHFIQTAFRYHEMEYDNLVKQTKQLSSQMYDCQFLLKKCVNSTK